MNPQEQQLIDALFGQIHQHAATTGPRDPQTEQYIGMHAQQTPGALYHMTQLLLGQQQLIAQLQAQLGGYGGQPYGGQPYGGGQPYPPGYPAPQQRGGGFLSGVAKVALGVGGGILAADAVAGIVDDLFDDDDDDSW